LYTKSTIFDEAILGSENTEIIFEMDDNNTLLTDEHELLNRGDLEYPELNNYRIEDKNYFNKALRVHKLVKEYPNNDKETMHEMKMVRAVDELTVSMFKNQIFVLLGHNGAGKTTTMSMLAG
jgi:ABC-type glutathione transport system ATPase component